MGAGWGARVGCKALRTNPLESADSSHLPGCCFFFFFSLWWSLPALESATCQHFCKFEKRIHTSEFQQPPKLWPRILFMETSRQRPGSSQPQPLPSTSSAPPAEPWNPTHREGARRRLGVLSLETAPSGASSPDHMTSADRQALEVDPEHHLAK